MSSERQERPCISCGQPTENLTQAYGRGKIWIHPDCIQTQTQNQKEDEAETQEVIFEEPREVEN